MIHRFENNGYRLVLDVHSGAVHVLDETAYELLGLLDENMGDTAPEEVLRQLEPRFSRQDLLEAYADLAELKREGLLFSADGYAAYAECLSEAPLKAMCLHIAHDCNLCCQYCFAGQGGYGGQHRVMSFEVAKAALDFLVKHSGARRHLELDFFGGEPLMNWDTVKRTVAYGRSLEKEYGKEFRFTLTTNATLLTDEIADFLNREMHNVVLSLDGRKEVHDKMRPYAASRGSYDMVVPKIQRFVEQRKAAKHTDYYVRGTFTSENLDFGEDVKHLYSLGFDQVSVEPVVAEDKEFYAIKEEHLPQIFAEYDRLAKDLLKMRKEGAKLNFFHFMLDLDGGPCAIKRLRGCGCGNEYAAVEPGGGVYPCHQFVGQPEWQMGDVLTGEYDLEKKKKFALSTVYHKEKCRDCWAKFFCSGGCNANNQQYAGDILRPYGMSCEMEKKRVECALMMKAAAAEEE